MVMHMETAPFSALCQVNVVSSFTAMCAFSWTLAVLKLHSRVIMARAHRLSVICFVFLFAIGLFALLKHV